MSTFAWSWNLPTNVACGRSTSRCRGAQHKLRYVEMIAEYCTKSLTFYITVYTYVCLIDYFLLYAMHWDLELHTLPRTLCFTAILFQIIFASHHCRLKNITVLVVFLKVIFRIMLTTIFGKMRVEVCLMQLILRIVTQMMCWSLFFQLLEKLRQLNADPTVHGIIVQLPLESDNEIDTHLVTNAIAAHKDVDGWVNNSSILIFSFPGYLWCVCLHFFPTSFLN